MRHGKKHGIVRCWRGGELVETHFIDSVQQVDR
jgi:hypothetical protein